MVVHNIAEATQVCFITLCTFDLWISDWVLFADRIKRQQASSKKSEIKFCSVLLRALLCSGSSVFGFVSVSVSISIPANIDFVL
jgi:hypothetical protein